MEVVLVSGVASKWVMSEKQGFVAESYTTCRLESRAGRKSIFILPAVFQLYGPLTLPLSLPRHLTKEEDLHSLGHLKCRNRVAQFIGLHDVMWQNGT